MKKNKNKRNHTHLAEDEYEEEEERPLKRQSKEEYVLFSSLSGFVITGEDTWLIDSGASKHMIGKNQTLSRLEENKSPQKV